MTGLVSPLLRPLVAGLLDARKTAAESPSVPGHRYWRITVQATGYSVYVSGAKIEFAAAVGGPDECTGGTAIGGGYMFNIPEAFDNNPNTAFSGRRDDGYIGYDFARDVAVVSMRFTSAVSDFGGGPPASPESFQVEYSDDNSSWTVAASFSGQTGWGYGETRTFNW